MSIKNDDPNGPSAPGSGADETRSPAGREAGGNPPSASSNMPRESESGFFVDITEELIEQGFAILGLWPAPSAAVSLVTPFDRGSDHMHANERPAFHESFGRALAFATDLHAGQLRKQTDIPYISHLIGVASIVLENGGNAEEAIAGLLHDSIEDCGAGYPGGVAALRDRIRADFGPAVLAIVEGCTDADTEPKPLWETRKKQYLAHLVSASESVRLVSCSDKLHNARALVADLRVMGDALFQRFNAGRAGTLWYYEALATEFHERGPSALAAELRQTVDAMKSLAKT